MAIRFGEHAPPQGFGGRGAPTITELRPPVLEDLTITPSLRIRSNLSLVLGVGSFSDVGFDEDSGSGLEGSPSVSSDDHTAKSP